MKLRTYHGITVDRIEHSDMYSALVPDYGYVKADTLSGIRWMIDFARTKII